MEKVHEQIVRGDGHCFEVVSHHISNRDVSTADWREGASLSRPHTKPTSTCKAIVHNDHDWVVRSKLHCESEPLPSPFLYSHSPVYQKYVCCYCVHNLSDTMTLITQKGQNDHFHSDSYEAIIQFLTVYSYSILCSLCVHHCVCFCQPCLIWRSRVGVPAETFGLRICHMNRTHAHTLCLLYVSVVLMQ